jgi:hypothetical protein
MDAMTIWNNAQMKARGFRTEGMNYEAQAELYKMQAKQAQTASWINAASSIIGGFSSAFSSMGSFGGGSSSVAPKWGEMASGSTYDPFKSSSGYTIIPQVAGFPG